MGLYLNGYRLADNNLSVYLDKNYGTVRNPGMVKRISGYTPLLQADYGKDYDCSLTCITAMLMEGDPKSTYDKVEEVAKKYFYNGDRGGTIPFFIKAIIDKVAGVNSKRGYGKGIGYNWEKIRTLIHQNKPIILSIASDGRNYYKNHSVTIVGYNQYNNGKIRLLAVYDNWHKEISYIDYNRLSVISSINYI